MDSRVLFSSQILESTDSAQEQEGESEEQDRGRGTNRPWCYLATCCSGTSESVGARVIEQHGGG
jgi:hypothetical protein